MRPSCFPSTVYWKDCLFLVVYSCLFCQRLTITHGFISGLFSVSVFVSVPCCLDYCSFVVYPEIRECGTSSSVVLSQDFLDYSGSLIFSFKFQIFFQFCENCLWYFDNDCIWSVDYLGYFNYFNNVLPVHEHRIIFPSVCVFSFFFQCFMIFQVHGFYFIRSVYY